MAEIPQASCGICAFCEQPRNDEPDEIVRVAVALEEHLARDHDLSWSRARETARSWLDRAIESTRHVG
ncbi:MAG: hypothetical protein JST54_33440 [Deltaproteobacteria bacterium]|nr:hypothetical protein [Deltaproteobacteria bacterium]